MEPETAFWLLSTTAQAAAALAGLGIVAWVFIIRRIREDLHGLIERSPVQIARGVEFRGTKFTRPLALSAWLYLLSVASALIFLSLVQPVGAVPWQVEVGAYLSVGLLIAGLVGLLIFLSNPMRLVADQVVVPMRPEEPEEKK